MSSCSTTRVISARSPAVSSAIVLPITAGYLFDLTHGYGSAIIIAAAGNALGVLVAVGLPHQRAARAEDRLTIKETVS